MAQEIYFPAVDLQFKKLNVSTTLQIYANLPAAKGGVKFLDKPSEKS